MKKILLGTLTIFGIYFLYRKYAKTKNIKNVENIEDKEDIKNVENVENKENIKNTVKSNEFFYADFSNCDYVDDDFIKNFAYSDNVSQLSRINLINTKITVQSLLYILQSPKLGCVRDIPYMNERYHKPQTIVYVATDLDVLRSDFSVPVKCKISYSNKYGLEFEDGIKFIDLDVVRNKQRIKYY